MKKIYRSGDIKWRDDISYSMVTRRGNIYWGKIDSDSDLIPVDFTRGLMARSTDDIPEHLTPTADHIYCPPGVQ